jgi:hypothetical protein
MFVTGIAIDGPTSETDFQARTSSTPPERRKRREHSSDSSRQRRGYGQDQLHATFEQVAAVLDEAKSWDSRGRTHRHANKAADLGHKYMEHMNTVAWSLLGDEVGYERWRQRALRRNAVWM